ncbi:MAG: hypothetical protein ACRDMY_03855 [Gaiellaceae bacterium]
MTDSVGVVLDEFVPTFDQERGDWERVLKDASAAAGSRVAGAEIPIRRGHRQRSLRRLVIIAAVGAAAISIPFVAVAASQNWWFFRFGESPTPLTDVMIVKTGTWDGIGWQLIAYRSSTDGICFGLTPESAGSAGEGAGLACDQIEGVPRTPQSKPDVPHGISYLSGSSEGLPRYIVGPVLDTAAEVAIHLDDGVVLRTPTFAAPDELGSAIRFYATQLPKSFREVEPPRSPIEKLVGLSADGRIVACLVDPMPEEGVPLSACR